MDSSTERGARPIAYAPALDGLRAIAVLAVLGFHGGLRFARGGFLGVSLFFTLSGFLITRLLLAEHAGDGRIRLRHFWERRLRRLAPASLVTLVGLTIATPHLADASSRASLRGDVLGALAYVANWRFLLQGRRYADLFSAPSPVLHFWSLAIEEQFYIVFPLLVALVLRFGNGSRRALAGVLGALAVGSVALQVVLHDVDRVYLGSDTRAAELLAGALLALAFSALAEPSRRARRATAGASVAAALLFVALCATTSARSPFLGDGGLALVALVNVAIVAGAAAGVGIGRVLAWRPLAAVGRVSYGLYLFHWPVFLWLDERHTGLHGVPLAATRLAVAGVITMASYHLLECPIRYRRVLRAPRRLVPAFATAVAVAVAISVAAPVARIEPLTDTSVLKSIVVHTASRRATPPLRVMVVGDATAARIVAALRRARDRFAVDDETRAGCSIVLAEFAAPVDIAPSHPLSTCHDWLTRWPARARRFRPDVIVVRASKDDVNLHPTAPTHVKAAAIHAFMAVRGAYSLAGTVLRRTGAVVAWSEPPDTELAALPGGAALRARAAFSAMLDSSVTVASSVELGVVSLDHRALEASQRAVGNEVWRAYRAGRAELGRPAKGDPQARPLRVLLAGDSTSLNLAAGLGEHGRDHGDLVVDWAGRNACPWSRVARFRELGDPAAFDAGGCEPFPRSWARHIASFKPDLVLVVTTFMEAADFERVRGGPWEHLGQPGFDEFFASELDAAATFARKHHVRLAWATAPLEDSPSERGTAELRDRLRALDAQLNTLARHRRGVAIVPLAAHVDRPDGRVDRTARPDGVHFTVAAAREMADRWLARELVAIAHRGLRPSTR